MSNKSLELLFNKQYLLRDGYTDTLFKSQKDLVNAIVDDGSYHNKGSLQSYLSMALKPSGTPGSRPLPNKMRDAILKVSLERLPIDGNIQSDFKVSFLNAVKALKQQQIIISTNDDLYEEFIAWIQSSPEQTIISNQPTELFWRENDRAKELMELLLNTLTDDKCTNRQYNFYLGSIKNIVEFWRSLEKYCLNVWSQKETYTTMDAFFKRLSELGNTLQVYQVAESESAIPCIYFKVENDNCVESSLFHLYYDSDRISIVRMPQAMLETWYSVKYFPLMQKRGSGDITEMKYHVIKSMGF